MKHFIWVFVTFLAVSAWARPALVVIDSEDWKAVEAHAVVVRDLGPRLFLAAEVSDLAGVPFQMVDSEYLPGHYLLMRGPRHATERGLPILWQDEAGALLRLPDTLDEMPLELSGGEERLEMPSPAQGDPHRPVPLDDPALDAWLTTLGASVNADSLFAMVSTLASYNRYTRWTSNDNAATWIRDKLMSYGLDSVYYHAFTASGSGWSRTANNVIGVLNGTTHPDSIVIIGGHMDATSENVSQGAPGADDNATGTAGMIEAARLLSQHPFAYTIMFIAFNGEEQGLQGSAALAQAMAAANRHVLGLLNMDMIGYYDPAGADLWIEGFYSGNNSIWLTDVLWDNCLQFTDMTPYLYPSNGYGSDHQSFHNAGFSAVLSIENEYDSYACYHRLCDLPNQITATFLRKMVLVNIVSGAELAQPQGTGGIAGTVTLEGTQDYTNVLVRVVNGSTSTTSAANGAYALSNLLAGTYDLAFSRTGWISDTLTSIVVVDGQQTTGQNIFLNASLPGSISGTVALSGGGGVITDAIVYVDDVLEFPAANGVYSLSPVFSGSHVVTAALNNYALASTVVTLTEGQNLTGVNLTLYPLWDFEASNFGLDNNNSGWAWGTDAVAGSHSATRVWGTVLGANYINCGNYRLDMPPVSLAHLDSARLIVWHWYDIEPSGPTVDYDGANVKIAPFGTENWQVLQPVGGYPQGAGYTCNPIQDEPAYNGTSGGWLQATFDLSAYLGQTVEIRFHLGSDQGVTRRGWYLDDLALLGWHSVQQMAPDDVADLTAYPSGNDIQLRWSPSAGATSYRIYRSPDSDLTIENWSLLATQPGTSYLDTDAAGLARAFYVVIAVN